MDSMRPKAGRFGRLGGRAPAGRHLESQYSGVWRQEDIVDCCRVILQLRSLREGLLESLPLAGPCLYPGWLAEDAAHSYPSCFR